MALGAISSYLLFAAGWTLFGIASVRARVIPLIISIMIIIGGIAGWWAPRAPGGNSTRSGAHDLGHLDCERDQAPVRRSRRDH
jgi:hypothetical protein